MGMRDANHLAETVESTTGIRLPSAVLESTAMATCAYMDSGATPRQAADMTADTLRGALSDGNARLLALAMTLEYCPQHADLGK